MFTLQERSKLYLYYQQQRGLRFLITAEAWTSVLRPETSACDSSNCRKNCCAPTRSPRWLRSGWIVPTTQNRPRKNSLRNLAFLRSWCLEIGALWKRCWKAMWMMMRLMSTRRGLASSSDSVSGWHLSSAAWDGWPNERKGCILHRDILVFFFSIVSSHI